jgi:3-oxocholest-4-en-26-oate---CoA ligase
MSAAPVSGWNFAEMWEVIADLHPDAPAQVQGDRRFTWRDFDRRADGIADTLLAAGVSHQDKVAQYLYNCPEYLESMFGLFKAGLIPVNTNYRYSDDELIYIWDNADAVAVIFHATFVPTIERIRDRVPAISTWICVDDASHPCPDWAVDYETAAASAATRVRPPWGRSGDDLYFLYTGGTTGMPKGVMWRQDDIVALLDGATKNPLPDDFDADALRAKCATPGPIGLPAAPLMHGTGAFNSMSVLIAAGSIVTMHGRSFDAVEFLDTVQLERVKSISMVGDAFGKPILRALDAEPDRWDISSLRVITSSGVMWSRETKDGLLRHNNRLIMIDALGSSEAIGMANNVSTAQSTGETAKFVLSANTRVLTEDGREVQPGSGERGRVALKGRAPLGYYKDEAKTAATFQTVNGVRYSIPGDWATIDADGTIALLGRGSQCINTGGEKVYPEEVEEVLKLHPGIADAVVVGVPDDRFGNAIWAMVEPAEPAVAPTGSTAGSTAETATIDDADVIAFVRTKLAAFKAPKRVITVASIERAPNGKVDYKRWTAEAITLLG